MSFCGVRMGWGSNFPPLPINLLHAANIYYPIPRAWTLDRFKTLPLSYLKRICFSYNVFMISKKINFLFLNKSGLSVIFFFFFKSLADPDNKAPKAKMDMAFLGLLNLFKTDSCNAIT